MEKARQSGQVVSKTAPEGTFASGVQKVTDVLSILMTELIQSAPENQREKISKLLDIWERGQTFPLDKLRGFKQKLDSLQNGMLHSTPDTRAVFSNSSISDTQSYTPPGTPPKNGVLGSQGIVAQPPISQAAAAPAPASAPDTNSILTALAALSRQNAPVSGQGNIAPAAPTAPVVPVTQPVAPVAQSPFSYQQPLAPPPPSFVPPQMPPAQAAPLAQLASNPGLLNLLQAVSAGQLPGLTPEQTIALMAAFATGQAPGGAPVIPPPPVLPVPSAAPPPPEQSRPPPDYSRYRGRSRSPEYNRRRGASPDRRSPPLRRDSPTYGTYEGHSGNDGRNGNRNDFERGRGRGRNRGRNDYRQRSPLRRQPSPVPRNTKPKFIEWDSSLPRDHIRVLSRTLFVGGANGSEADLREIFGRFGTVQTCIVNHDKRHAFVKMVNREDAVAAKNGMDHAHDSETTAKARQVSRAIRPRFLFAVTNLD